MSTTRADKWGLCLTCQFARFIRNDKGSIFIMCRRSEDDPRFPKYPRLPVLACAGYGKRARENSDD